MDLNAFQHYSFLNSFNEANSADLTVIGESYISPLGLYSNAIKDVSEIKEGDTIIIPNDPTNLGRALTLLETAGLLSVDPSVDIPTVENILENPKSLKIEALDASQTARSLDDATASVINGGMAVDAGLVPTEDAIYLEELSATSKPYINVIVSRAEEKDKEVFKTIIETFTTPENAKVIKDVTKGACIPIWEL